jgi:hypothetical protein
MNNNTRCVVVGRMCWPTGLTIPRNVAHASRLVCQHPEHQETAAKWVEKITGHRGAFQEVPHRG